VYVPSGEERIVAIEPALPECDAGAPMPTVVAHEGRGAVAYWTADDPDRRVAVATFRFVSGVLFGSPNDEAFNGHPLFEAGLRWYTFVEVLNSQWIAALERQNRVHRQHDPARFAGLRHFILPFHDTTFECVASEVHGRLVDAAGPRAALVATLLEA
jgi:hypothetical protein